MKELVGKYARFGNEIFEIEDELIDDIVHLIYDDKGLFLDILDKENNIVIKDDPRELIEVGDLVKDKTKRGSVLEINRIDINSLGARLLYSFGTPILFGNITEIWTKIDKDTYKCQWRKENE